MSNSIGKVTLQKFISEGYYNILVDSKCKIIAIIFYLIIIVLSIFFNIFIWIWFRQWILVTKNNDLFNYIDTQKNILILVYLVL